LSDFAKAGSYGRKFPTLDTPTMTASQLSVEYEAMTERHELYAKYGFACEAAQLFETELGTLLLSLQGLEAEWHSQPDPIAASKYLDEINKNTMGRLLHRLRGHLTFEGDLEGAFTSALTARNRLMHGFFERHNLKIQSHDGRAQMIADLDRLHQEVFDAWQWASQLSNVMVTAFQLAKAVASED
jgi:hypothetical protein